MRSLPSRERGLKFWIPIGREVGGVVAPFTGAWIEIDTWRAYASGTGVAPFTGAWIEITTLGIMSSAGSGRSLHGSVD